MLTSLAIIFLLGLIMGEVFKRRKLPGLIGMILVGILVGPYMWDLLDESILEISSQLRQIALVIILTRAGLSLELADLKKVGRPAVLMCFVPACCEILAVTLLAPALLGVTRVEAALMGSVIAAVSPAVVVPRMIKLIEDGYGKEHSVPQLIMAGASVDDIFVIVLFSAFASLASGGKVTASSFAGIPVSIIVGAIVGIAVGLLLVAFFRMTHMRDTMRVLILLSVSFLMLECENQLEGFVPMSGLLAIMCIGIILKQKSDALAIRISERYNKLWVAAEILLFVLVGATVDLKYALKFGVAALVLVIGALCVRMFGVCLCVVKTKLTKKERIFCMLAYTPKATVQAAIGGIPLAMGLACGQKILTVAVLAILFTAPFGAICMDKTYKKFLKKC